METGGQPKDPRIDKFWNKYSDILRLFRIPERAIPWYRRHIQTFINDHPNIRLREHTVESVEIWLGNLGRNPQITDWQFQQKVDALRLLFCHFLKLPWGDKFEWDLWFSGAKSLGKDHPTVARSYEMIYKAAENPNNKLGKKHPDLYHKYLISIRIPDYSPNTEKSYLSWINRFLLFHGQIHPCDCSEPEVASFLEYLAMNRKVSGSTQRQALNAQVFFFARVLEKPLSQIGPYKRPKKPKRLPTVLSPKEIHSLFEALNGTNGLMIRLMYGTGMRVMECVKVRIKELDFDYLQITVRAAKERRIDVFPCPRHWLSH